MDLISRQAAIDALGEKPLAWTEGEYELGLQNQWQSDVDALNSLPSAQPDKPRPARGRSVLKDNEDAQTDKPNRVATGRSRCVTRDHAGRQR